MSTLPQNDPINPRQLNRTQQLDKPRPAGKPRAALLMEALAWGAKIETPHGTLELAWSEDGHPVLAQALSVYRNGRTDGVPDETFYSQVDLSVADLLRYAEAMTDEEVVGHVFYLSMVKSNPRRECELATTMPRRRDPEVVADNHAQAAA